MSERPVTGAVIGCGAISKAHLTCMKEAGYRVGSLCDVDRARAEQAKREFGTDATRVTTDYAELLADPAVDVVAVCTPPALHREQTVAALEAGKFVYCEKPVVRTLAEFGAIFAAEASSGKRAYFTPARRRGGATPMIRQYIQAGDLGEVYRVESRHWRARGRPGVDSPDTGRWFADSRLAMGGILADIGLYHIDCAFHLTGWPAITAVSAVVMRPFADDVPPGTKDYDVEEHALILARTEGRLTFTFELANIAFYDDWYTETLMLLGNKGGMHVRNGRQDEFRFLTEKGGPGKFVEHRIDWKEKRRTDTVIYEELAAAVRGEGEVRTGTTSRQCLTIHEVMAMAYLSSHEKREVRPQDLDRSAPIFIKT